MEYVASDKTMERYVTDTKFRVKKLGAAGAKQLQTRLKNLEAAVTLEDLRDAPGHLHELKGDRAGQFGWTITGSKRLVIISVLDPPPLKPDGGLDWTAIKAVKLSELVDYH